MPCTISILATCLLTVQPTDSTYHLRDVEFEQLAARTQQLLQRSLRRLGRGAFDRGSQAEEHSCGVVVCCAEDDNVESGRVAERRDVGVVGRVDQCAGRGGGGGAVERIARGRWVGSMVVVSAELGDGRGEEGVGGVWGVWVGV